jgi:hypothetical protein
VDLSTELVLSHPQGFGLVTATPAQRAICRAIDGLPIPDELWEHSDDRYAEFGPTRVSDIFGGVRPHVGSPPRTVILLSGARCGKSRLISAVAAKAAIAGANLDGLHSAEKARVSVLSTVVDVARSTFGQVLGGFQNSPLLAPQLTGRPRRASFDVRHTSGRPVEIQVVAGARSGNTLVSRWCAGAIIDEAPRQASGSDGFTVNIEDQLDSLSARMLPGAQIFLPGSPIGPTGYVYTKFEEHYGQPNEDFLVIRAPAYLLNPFWWTPERVAKLRIDDLDNFRSECMGEFRGQDDALFSADAIKMAQRAEGQEVEPPYHGHRYYASIDPATRANAWTFAIGTVSREGFVTVALAKQWQGSKEKPLNPAEIFREMKPDLDRYGVKDVASDQYHYDANKELAKAAGIKLRLVTSTQAVKTEMFEDLRQKFLQAEISIPPDQDIRSDLLMVRRRITPKGVPTVVLVVGTNKRHCDYAACLALLNHQLSYAPRTLEYDPGFNRFLPMLRGWG